MATDIKISELNEIVTNDNLNHIIVNDRENAGDEGITKKIKLENFLTPNLVKEVNINNSAVTSSKIAGLAVDCTKIAANTITCNQIAQCTINNFVLDSNAVDNRVLNDNCAYTVKRLVVGNGEVNISNPINGCLRVNSGITNLNSVAYYWPHVQQANRFLKTDGAGNLSWAEAVPGESTSLVFSEISPVGTIVPWAGQSTLPSDGKWLECNGQQFNGNDYPDLALILGEIWGTRSGNLYRLPDLRGRVAIGAGENISDGTTVESFEFTESSGKYKHQLTTDELPSHFHYVASNGSASTGDLTNTNQIEDAYNFKEGGSMHTGNCHFEYDLHGTSSAANVGRSSCVGANTEHNNVQPYTTVRYIIKALKDDIQQFNPVLGPGLSASDANGTTSNITLTSTNIGVRINDDNLTYDTSNAIALKDDISVTNLSASSIKFNDGTIQTVAPTISGVSEGLVGDGTGALHTLYEVEHGLGRTPTLTQFFWKCKSTANGKNYGYEVGTELYITSQSDSGLGHMTAAAGPTKIYYYNGWDKMVYAKTTGTYLNSNFQPANTTDNWELRYRVFV